MKIIYTDGSILKCNVIFIEGNELNADDLYTVSLDDVLRIEEGE